MKKIAFALAAAGILALSVPVATPVAAATTKKVIIKKGGDRGLHRGWAHSRHRGATKKVIIKRGGEGRTVKKVIKRGED